MLTADQILSEQYVSVNPGTSVGKAIERMVEENTSIILVASDDYQLIGTLTESVLLRATMDSHLRQDPVSLHMTRRFSSVSRHAPLDVVLDQFVLHDLQFLPVLGSDGYVAGVISRVDLLRTVFGSKLENSQIAG
ncbi:MAG: CBS domain-containing protein [Planctomycetaceae bacterium]|nr:CBS domain-containing protein [Planctomycetaceae bacterium]MCP4462856.1 CBS domain-containing protein [Planctomycetaceae bacterium]MDG1808811.1 CBS domain-containing protein [Pirellulaceae bacterium]MDG2102867.1 CBS domain-containing protein [Pirellulaceae bacterium]